MSSVYDKMTEPEKEIASYFEEKNLWWKFEFPVFIYDEKDRPRIWTPDFYIPALGVFIEVCGSINFDYEYREKIYDKNGIPVVFLHYYKKRKVWKTFLADRIEYIEQKRESESRKLVK